MKFSFLLVSIISLSFSFFGIRDSDRFSGDPELYLDELEAFMANVSDDQELILETFIKAWEVDSLFTQDEKEDMAKLSPLMEVKNARAFPHFINFISSYMAFKEHGISEMNYANWVEGFESYLKRRKTKSGTINQLLVFTNNLVSENSLNRSTSVNWVATGEYKIIADKGIVVEFEETDIICFAKRDSIMLFETSGRVIPEENRWEGNGGLLTWERGGYAAGQVFAHLKEYKIELKKSEYFAEEVEFTNKIYFEEPLLGQIHDKVMVVKSPDKATYPKFFSYTKTFEIEDLYKDIDFSGGLSMQGAKLVGTGEPENTAKLKIYRNDTLVLVANSLFFGFKSDRISSMQTSLSIKLKQDSIFHPDLMFNYRVANRELVLQQSDNFSSLAPYFNSYHRIDMNFDQLLWRMDEDKMRFTAKRGATIGNAYFESQNFFNYNKFVNLQMMDRVHPLLSLRSFSRRYGDEEFPVEAFADYLSMPLHQVKQMAMRMAFNGFVFYDSNTGTVRLKPRLHDYLAASVNKIDYDVIGIPSTVEAPLENAVFDLRTYDLKINGIPQIYVSDSQDVAIIPRNASIIMKQNRNFQFDGIVDAGLMSFYGNNFFFHYDSFKVTLQNVDSINMKFQTGELDNYGLALTDNVRNRLMHVTGEVLIDKSDNKSGRESYPEYPVFKSKENSYIYYNQNNEQGTAYDPSDFYFEVFPFEMDSLDNFNKDALKLRGEFVSAGIFPEFEKDLVLQPDNSLGFRHKSPSEGLPTYGGKGIYNNEIWLSNRGLRGNGTLKYITSTTWSDDFIFFPDSMNTLSQKYDIAIQTVETEYPTTNSINNEVHWEPYADKMYVRKTDTDFTMYNDSTTLNGNLLLEPSGLTGEGRMDLKNSDLTSEEFTYKAYDIYADTSDFYLKSLNIDGFTVLTENVNSHIDYRQRKGFFKSNEDFALVNFPENKYISYLNYFTWDMLQKQLAMGTQTEPQIPDYTHEDIEPEGPRYISLHHDQDSLSFVSPLAYYDYQDNLIKATGVKFIEVADARIYPFEGRLSVEANADMNPLENSWLKANKFSQYHRIHSANIKIYGKQFYQGNGNYDYVDENDEVQNIHFSLVKADTSGTSIATGEIFTESDFTLSPVYRYHGMVYLVADRPLLEFKGHTLVEHNCDRLKPKWLKFHSEIDPQDIYIPLANPALDIDENSIYNGVFVYYDSVHVYPSFLTPHKYHSDNQVVGASGYLYYDKGQELYKIGSKEKINDFNLSQNYVSFHREDCKLYGEGNVNLGENLGQIKVKSIGNVRHDVNKNETVLDLVLALDFFIHDENLAIMANEIDSLPNLPAVSLSRPTYKKAMNAMVGEEKANKIYDELNLFGTIKELPPALKHTILFSELKLVWNNETNSYMSDGQIGIASINNVQINKKLNGFIELKIKRSGDILDIYLDLGRKKYYYFGYTRGVMQTLSHNKQYVQAIMELKSSENKVKTSRGETPYRYIISTDRKKNNFYRRYRDIVEEKVDEAQDDFK